MAISSTYDTIEPHLKAIPNKFELARVVMLRTRQLIDGAKIKKGVDPTLRPRKRRALPNSRAPKVALDEILLGEIKFERTKPTEKPIVISDVVFSSI